jgi:hypothetical protein
MRTPLAVLSITLLAAQAVPAEDRSLVFLFGPTTEERGRAAAHAAATITEQWFQSAGSSVEIRFTSNTDTQQLGKTAQIKDLESSFVYAAQTGRQSDTRALANGFDRATLTLSHHAGKRLLIAILESPVLTPDVESRLDATLAFCKENSIGVIVADISEPASKEPPPALLALAASSGGALVRDLNALAPAVQKLIPMEKPVAVSEVPKQSGPQAFSVHTRFLRIQSSKARAEGKELGPMHGFLVAESPLSALTFETKGGSYQAQARVTEVVRNAEGKTVWQAKKDITIKGPARKLESRQAGNLCYMRELQMPGGQYTLEATVEDLLAQKTVNTTEPLAASPTTQGFDLSDIVLVRRLDDAVDRFESDTILQFDSKAIVPLLDPPYRARQPFDLDIYMVLYPDASGGRPQLDLDILHDGQPVAHSRLSFSDKVRNGVTEGSGLDSTGTQKRIQPERFSRLAVDDDTGGRCVLGVGAAAWPAAAYVFERRQSGERSGYGPEQAGKNRAELNERRFHSGRGWTAANDSLFRARDRSSADHGAAGGYEWEPEARARCGEPRELSISQASGARRQGHGLHHPLRSGGGVAAGSHFVSQTTAGCAG